MAYPCEDAFLGPRNKKSPRKAGVLSSHGPRKYSTVNAIMEHRLHSHRCCEFRLLNDFRLEHFVSFFINCINVEELAYSNTVSYFGMLKFYLGLANSLLLPTVASFNL